MMKKEHPSCTRSEKKGSCKETADQNTLNINQNGGYIRRNSENKRGKKKIDFITETLYKPFPHKSFLKGELIFYGAVIALECATDDGKRFLRTETDKNSPNFGKLYADGLTKTQKGCEFEVIQPKDQLLVSMIF